MKDFDSKLRLMLCGWRLSLFLAAVAGLLILCVAIGNLSWLYDNLTRRMLIFFLLLPAGLTVTFTWPRNQHAGRARLVAATVGTGCDLGALWDHAGARSGDRRHSADPTQAMQEGSAGSLAGNRCADLKRGECERFGRDALGLCVIECLNELRTVFLGLSFGDQGQFFRRAAIIAEGGFPKLPLMEDVELSLRLRAAGPVLYLGGGLICSDRRWQKENWFKCCATVIAMTAIYRFRRREAAQVVDALYRRYYSVPKL
jgi:hypothetical protein